MKQVTDKVYDTARARLHSYNGYGFVRRRTHGTTVELPLSTLEAIGVDAEMFWRGGKRMCRIWIEVNGVRRAKELTWEEDNDTPSSDE